MTSAEAARDLMERIARTGLVADEIRPGSFAVDYPDGTTVAVDVDVLEGVGGL